MLSQVTLGKSRMMRAVVLICLVAAIGCRRKSSDAKPESGVPMPAWEKETASGGQEKPHPGIRDGIEKQPPIIVDLPTIYFDFDAVSIRSDQMKFLDTAVFALREQPVTTLLLQGHADERGTTEYNMHLGERRALAVKDYLVRVGGIAAERIQIISKGEEDPEDVGHSEEAWAKNRRVEFFRVK